MEREFYPALNPRFVVPRQVNDDSLASTRDIQDDDIDNDLTISINERRLRLDEEYLREAAVAAIPDPVVAAIPEPVVAAMPEPVVAATPEPVVAAIPEPL
jgi:hypothetical protein